MQAADRGLDYQRQWFRFDLLVSPGFLYGLTILLLNDHVLKGLFHN